MISLNILRDRADAYDVAPARILRSVNVVRTFDKVDCIIYIVRGVCSETGNRSRTRATYVFYVFLTVVLVYNRTGAPYWVRLARILFD